MKTVIATEGQGEFSAFKHLFGSLVVSTGTLSSTVLRVACQPDGPVKGIAKACGAALRQAKARNVELFVLVIDREQQQEPVGVLAEVLRRELEQSGPWPFEIKVVYKDRAFENWLVADVKAVQ
ncbi:hypothetical protein Q9Q99_14100 [Curtobacterium flaccumfaciens]|nr:hypothetical protein Q9Q99_14100 [Curtobacterium flaccumfaciens]